MLKYEVEKKSNNYKRYKKLKDLIDGGFQAFEGQMLVSLQDYSSFINAALLFLKENNEDIDYYTHFFNNELKKMSK